VVPPGVLSPEPEVYGGGGSGMANEVRPATLGLGFQPKIFFLFLNSYFDLKPKLPLLLIAVGIEP
jgi:hypothetical protein